MSQMTFEQAVTDPNRPLSLTPGEWMYALEAALAEETEAVENSSKRIAADAGAPPPKTGVEKIDLGIDQIVQGVRIVQSGIEDSRMVDMDPKTRQAIEKIKDLLETAIAPYMVDIIAYSDSMEGTGK